MPPEKMTRRPLDAAGVIVMLGLCSIWGFQQVAMKAVATQADPLMQVAARSSIAAILVWTYSRFWRRDIWVKRLGLREGLLVGALFGIQYLCLAIGLRHIGSGLLSILLYTAPIFVAIFLHPVLPEERMSARQWIGCGLSFAGVALILLAPGAAMQELAAGSTPLVFGSLCALAAGLFWGLTTVTVRLSALSEAPFAQTLFYQLLGGAVCAWPVVLARDLTYWEGGRMLWLVTAYQSVIVCFASYLIWFWLLQRYLASRLSMTSLLTPVVGVGLGALILSEPLTPQFLIAIALFMTGLVIVATRDRKNRP